MGDSFLPKSENPYDVPGYRQGLLTDPGGPLVILPRQGKPPAGSVPSRLPVDRNLFHITLWVSEPETPYARHEPPAVRPRGGVGGVPDEQAGPSRQGNGWKRPGHPLPRLLPLLHHPRQGLPVRVQGHGFQVARCPLARGPLEFRYGVPDVPEEGAASKSVTPRREARVARIPNSPLRKCI